ncbi:phosphoribosylformylglycinamidine synthase subunit PurS [Virgibacillus pantothenticus]|uniref:Phosphoribosylformylglycinamidine synthase subunit PurS n=1 Tax=Virgibacillus pantothenticus TaxID=1473 RepID=A0A0L0QL13_VIRPA|nr:MULTISPECIES: phosphoribosylformylglycinamidine synthase subunit PurS [Virgibacillus]API91439.1 phosphoribosylformylglycinamidine synthase subunit PurS [Virgibacillus sp. 6R]KNE19199.1 phosphoribosylformylglycinamidine synthase [Virgibacillus pantothenticus]MBS7426691.1 phosphoribosylformylglycinamidine synthase subunit PurS [Virgibacillus sp. 19R1-5]MED3736126.1 phosphoribosylformylglycinamidine synthase subunit PurS [Virgibacillus pantothenticus]QTY15661.1 phosphoribosylformylglycinamidin
MKKVMVHITLKAGVLDPQGKAIQHSLHALGYTEVEDARVGKMIELQVEEGPELETRITEMCDKLLANPVIENYQFTIEEAVC